MLQIIELTFDVLISELRVQDSGRMDCNRKSLFLK